MKRRNLILVICGIGCFIAAATLVPSLGSAQADKVKAAMADLKARTEKLGTPKVEGKDLYFGTTKTSKDLVDAVVKEHGGAATLFVKAGNEYVRVATTLQKEDGSSAAATSPAVEKLSVGQAYYGAATVFAKPYFAGYEPIKDASGAVLGAYFVGQRK